MTTPAEPGLAAYSREARSTTEDARFAYLLFLGRAAESREARLSKAGRPFDQLIGGFLLSEEFLAEVARPWLSGSEASGGRFPAAPSRRMTAWAADRLLSAEGARALARQSRSWRELWRALLGDPRFKGAVEACVGPGSAEAMDEGLLVSVWRDENPAHRPGRAKERLAPGLGPLLSLLMIARRGAAGDLLATLCGVLDQDYQRWELVIVDDGGRREISRLVDAFATLDPRIRMAHAEPAETEAQSALSGYDLARGDYLGLLSPGVRLAADVLGRAGYAAAVRGRPELMKLELCAPTAEVAAPAPVYLIRADAAARAGLYQEAADEGLVGGLVRRAQAQGARLEVVGSVGGREAGLRTDSVSGDRA